MALNTPKTAKNDFARPVAPNRVRTSNAKASIKSNKQSFDKAMHRSEEKFATAQKTDAAGKSNEKKQVTKGDNKSQSAEAEKNSKTKNTVETIAKEIKDQKNEQEVISEASNDIDVASDAVIFVPDQVMPSDKLELTPIAETDEIVMATDMVIAVTKIETMLREVEAVIDADTSNSAEKLMAEVDVLAIEKVVQANSSELELQLSKEEVKLLKNATDSLKDYIRTQKAETSPEFEKLNSIVKKLNGSIVSTKTVKSIMSEQMLDEPQMKSAKTSQMPEKNVNASIKDMPETRVDQPILEMKNIEVSNHKIEIMRTTGKIAVFEQVKEAIVKAPITAGEQSEIIIKLKPEELGKVELKIEVHNDIVIAKFDVASQMVKEVLESNLEDLKNALKDKGFEDLSFDVNVNKDNQQKQQGQTSKHRRRIRLETSTEDGNESYVKSLSAMINENAFEHLA